MPLRISKDSLTRLTPPGPRVRLSLCMIAKDEEKNLPRCLESVKGLVDETIVVDTGSSDSTKEIAVQYGARVVDFPWRDDFSAARNESLRYANGQWILFLDADEELVREDGEALRGLLDDGERDAWFLNLINFRGKSLGGGVVTASAVRLFRNRPSYRFRGPIHEQVLPSIEAAGGKVGVSHVRINHYGYMADEMRVKNKVSRNLRILGKVVGEHPGDAFALYNLGVEHMKARDYQGALAILRESLARCSADNLREQFGAHLLRETVVCLGMLGQVEGALDFVRDAKKIHPNYTDLHYFEGVCLLELKRFREAENAFRTCLMLGDPPGFYISEAGIGGKMAEDGLKRALRGQQKKRKKRK